MYTILLADDEPRHLRGISEMIRRLRPSYTIFEATNGAQAIAIAGRHSLDFAITDIRMPFRDGLDLLGEISVASPRTKVVLLTGYANFEYARQALRLGAFDYVLKPVNEEKILRVLENVEERIGDERRTGDAGSRENSDLAAIRLVREGPGRGAGAAILRTLGGSGPGFVCAWVLERRGSGTAEGEAELPEELRESLKGLVKDAIDPAFPSLCFFDEGAETVLITITIGEVAPERLFRTGGLEALREKTASEFGYDTTIGIGNAFAADFRGIGESYRTALGAAELRFYFDSPTLFYRTDPAQENRGPFSVKYADEVDLSEAVKRADRAGARRKIEEILDALPQSAPVPPGALKEEIARTLLAAAKASRNFVPASDYSAFAESVRAAIRDSRSLAALREIACVSIETAIETMSRDRSALHDSIIRSCEAYINEHYHEDLSLIATAEKYGFTSYYFGSLFKRATNSTFNEYLRDVRMRRAVELLEDVELKIYEIAERIGYRDVKYFIRVFKSAFGVAPDEFRKTRDRE